MPRKGGYLAIEGALYEGGFNEAGAVMPRKGAAGAAIQAASGGLQ